MKLKCIFKFTILLLLTACEKQNKPNTNDKVKSEIIYQHKSDTSKELIEQSTNQNNFLPCNQYPPTDWRSCNYIGSIDDSISIFTNAIYVDGMLNFNTTTDFINTLDQIDLADENYKGYDAYMNYFGGNLYRIDSLLDAKGIDEISTFVNFEKKFNGFISMRKDIETKENVYLNNGGDPASEYNPDNINVISDDVFRTVLSKDGGVKIQGIIFKYFNNGVCYAVLNGNLELFNKINNPAAYGIGNNPDYFSSHFFSIDTTNVKLLTPKLLCNAMSGNEQLPGDETNGSYPCNASPIERQMGVNCKLWYKQVTPAIYYNGNKNKFISKIAVYNTLIYDAGISRIRNYKLSSNGKWKSARANMSAYVKESGCGSYEKNKNIKYRKFRRAAKRDLATFLPGLGQLFQGIGWMATNLLGNSNGFSYGYYSYFLTATNGEFYGENYCNNIKQVAIAHW